MYIFTPIKALLDLISDCSWEQQMFKYLLPTLNLKDGLKAITICLKLSSNIQR